MMLSNPFDPAREAALVTGAGNGIGRAIAQALVAEGVRTVFADVNKDTVEAIPRAGHQRCLARGVEGIAQQAHGGRSRRMDWTMYHDCRKRMHREGRNMVFKA